MFVEWEKRGYKRNINKNMKLNRVCCMTSAISFTTVCLREPISKLNISEDFVTKHYILQIIYYLQPIVFSKSFGKRFTIISEDGKTQLSLASDHKLWQLLTTTYISVCICVQAIVPNCFNIWLTMYICYL